MNENKWRFPASNHGERKGISSGDTEAFKKSPYQAFAREVLQNSIDARLSDEEPTIVEFKEFVINTDEIPGVWELKESIRRCKEFWIHKEDYVKEYESMLNLFDSDNLRCLRISDYNTTGLVGVDSVEQKNNKFLALTKGTGVSEKSGSMAGGSKGVGKNAVFLMSKLRTVFYSTNANKNLDDVSGSFLGFIGVSELVSGYVDDRIVENRDYTQGTGYYSSDAFNNPLRHIFKLDKNQPNRLEKTGTDIYIIGFESSDDWEKEVINSILDSFMSTIVRGELEVNFNGTLISKDTIKEIVYNESIIFKSQKANIISQYKLLTDGENVRVYDVNTEYGSCQLYILPFKKEEDELATHKCSMIRHPLMKIKDEPLGSSFRVSAMCIIGEGTLGETLRSIENPQHIDWEPKRIADKSIRREIENVIRGIKEQIKERVIECLQIGENNPLDPNGAGDYLPDVNFGDSRNEYYGSNISAETISVSKPKENITIEKNVRKESDNGTGLSPDIGGVNDDVFGEVQHPIGENDYNGIGRHPGPEESGEKEGDNVIFKRSKLSGVKYKLISTDRMNGKLRIIFTSPVDYNNCYLSVLMLDDANITSNVNILKMNCNGVRIIGKKPSEYGPFKIVTNQKIVLDVETDAVGYFGSVVKVICK